MSTIRSNDRTSLCRSPSPTPATARCYPEFACLRRSLSAAGRRGDLLFAVVAAVFNERGIIPDNGNSDARLEAEANHIGPNSYATSAHKILLALSPTSSGFPH